MFNKLIHKLDNALMKSFNPPTQYCDGCGNEYPSYFLSHVADWTGDFCKTCIKHESIEGYKAWCGMCDDETIHIGLYCSECQI